jgi:hypothetical protein
MLAVEQPKDHSGMHRKIYNMLAEVLGISKTENLPPGQDSGERL